MSAPNHIAIIMDGNGRWAQQQGEPRQHGHVAGVAALKNLVAHTVRQQIPYLTVFAFSRENWARPAQEVSDLMGLFVTALQAHLPELIQQGVCLKFIGQRECLDPKVIDALVQAEKPSAEGGGLTLVVALDYSGRWDIEQACMARSIDKNPKALEAYLSTAGLPDPDLLIRTGGELRISNFYLWQAAYAELYFTEILWPDFKPENLDQAIEAYHIRERRFGRVEEHV